MSLSKISKLGLALGLLSMNSFAQAPASYYNGTQNLSGFNLKTKLYQIVAQKTISWNYSDLPVHYEQTDRDNYYENDGSLLDIYSENPTGPDPYNYWYANNSLTAGAATEGEGWNREHIYSQSFFNSNYPMYSDLHFVVPTDARVNQARSNFPFGKVGNSPTFTSLNGTKRGPANMPNYTLTVYEPIDEFKGDIARMLMFVAVRYENLIPYFQYTNVRNPIDSLSEKAFKNWYISLLLQWHQQDPVSQKEIDRNNAVFNIQGNRNPFIDHPEFATAIWSNMSTSTDVPEQPFQIDVANVGAKFIHITWPQVQDVDVMGFEVYLNDVKVGTCKDNYYVLHHLQAGTAYDIKVRSYSHAYVNSPFTSASNISTLPSDTFSNDLFISKFIVGSDNNKAIEITNNMGYPVDLRDYAINIRQENQTSGSLFWSSNKVQFEGVLAHGRKLVLLNPLAQLSCFEKDSADILSNAAAMRFDGKFAVDLSYANASIDRLGSSSVIADYAVDKSLYRKEGVKNPNTSYDTAEWDVHPVDYCEGLGNPSPPTSALTNINKQQRFNLYPNPNQTGILEVEGEGLEKVKQLKIISPEGRILYSLDKPFAQSNTIQLPTNSKGMLIVSIDGKGYLIIVQ